MRLHQDKLSEAESLQEQAIELHGVALYHVRLGQILWRLGGIKRQGSLKVFLRAAKLDPGNSTPFTYLGHHYMGSAKTAERALRCYEKAVELEPLDTEAGEALYKMYVARKQDASVLTLCKTVTQAAFGVHVGKIKWAWLGLGRSLLAAGKLSEAVDSCQMAIRAGQDDVRAWQLLGEAYQARGAYVAALNAYKKCVDLDPRRTYAHYQIAVVNGKLGLQEEAIQCYENVLHLQPKYLPAHFGLAELRFTCVCEQLNDGILGAAAANLQLALGSIACILNIEPTFSCAWKLLGDLCCTARDLPLHLVKAITLPEVLAATDGHSTEDILAVATVAYERRVRLRHLAEGWIDLANVLCLRGRRELEADARMKLLIDSLNAGKCAVNLAPDSHVCWNALGVVAAFAGNTALSQHAFIKSINLETNNSSAWVNLGSIYLQNERFDLANKAFSVAQSLEPSLSRAWVGQAMIAERIGSVESLDLFRHALELHHHPQACFGFACHVIKASAHATNEDADASQFRDQRSMISRINGSPEGGGDSDVLPTKQTNGEDGEDKGSATTHIPRGYEEQYIAQGVVAATKYTAFRPDDACAWNLLGLMLERQQLHGGAANAFKSSASLLTEQGGKAEQLKVAKHNLARALCAHGMYADALEVYRAAGVEHFHQICGLGLAAYRAGQLPVSYQAFEKALAAATATAHTVRVAGVHVALGIVAYANADVELSKQLLFKAVADPRLCPRALFVMCGLGLLRDDGVLASSALAEFPKLRSFGMQNMNQHVADLHWLTSCLLRLQGHAKFARNALLKSVRMFPNASAMWARVAAYMNGNPELMVVDWDDLAAKRFDSATPCAEAAWAVRSQNIDKTPGKALTLVASGLLVAGRDGDIREAYYSSLKAVHENPSSPDSWSVVAVTAYSQGVRFGDASLLRIATRAAAMCRSQAEDELARITQAGRESARKAGLAALVDWSLTVECESMLASALCDPDAQQRETLLNAAMQGCTAASEACKSRPGTVATFYVLVARCYVGLQQYGLAVRTAVQALKIAPGNAPSWQVLGNIFGDMRMFPEAEACFRQSLAATQVGVPARLATFVRLALAALQSENTALCLEAATEAMHMNPQLAPVRLVLGLAKRESGDTKVSARLPWPHADLLAFARARRFFTRACFAFAVAFVSSHEALVVWPVLPLSFHCTSGKGCEP